jgi:DNA-binding NarL/FixJ family response regulator
MNTNKSVTPIEAIIIQGFAEGKDYHDISSELNLSIHEIQRYVNNVFCKLEIQDMGRDIIEKVELDYSFN